LIAAFKSPAAQAARQSRREAIEKCRQLCLATADVLREAHETAEAALKEAMKPLQEKLSEQIKPFTSALELVRAQSMAIQQSTTISSGEKLDALQRCDAETRRISALSRPYWLQFELDTQPLRNRYHEQMAPVVAEQEAACKSIEEECERAVEKADAQIDSILGQAIGPWIRLRDWLCQLLGGSANTAVRGED
jgi:translation initiation factor 2B subunit (eIF-2B alpha/beta/delta family)